MANKPITFDEALKHALPEMTKSKDSLADLVLLLEYCIDVLHRKSSVVESLTGMGSDGEFSFDINEFHGIYWISANEFDDIGYFNDKVAAVTYAEEEFEPYIISDEYDFYDDEDEELEDDEDDEDDEDVEGDEDVDSNDH